MTMPRHYAVMLRLAEPEKTSSTTAFAFWWTSSMVAVASI